MPQINLSNNPDLLFRKLSRLGLIGAPNTFKTTSLATFDRPLFILSYPGETGTGSIPQGEGITAVGFERIPGNVADTPTALWSTVRSTTIDAITGKYGPLQTFAGDGLYQLATVALDVVSDGAFSRGDKVDPFLYPRATNMVTAYLQLLFDSPIPCVVLTMWEGKEVIGAMDNVKSEAPRGLYPHLPGALAKQVMGLLSLACYCEVGATIKRNGKDTTEAWWRLKPTASIRAAGMKVPKEVYDRLPEKVPQDWQQLKQTLQAAIAVATPKKETTND